VQCVDPHAVGVQRVLVGDLVVPVDALAVDGRGGDRDAGQRGPRCCLPPDTRPGLRSRRSPGTGHGVDIAQLPDRKLKTEGTRIPDVSAVLKVVLIQPFA
jgi:hypothetical protein